MALSVAKANEVARQLDREFNGAGDRMLASASRVLVPTTEIAEGGELAAQAPAGLAAAGASAGRDVGAPPSVWLGEGPSSLASETPIDGPSHPKDAA